MLIPLAILYFGRIFTYLFSLNSTPAAEETPKEVEATKEETNGHAKNGDSKNGDSKNGDSKKEEEKNGDAKNGDSKKEEEKKEDTNGKEDKAEKKEEEEKKDEEKKEEDKEVSSDRKQHQVIAASWPYAEVSGILELGNVWVFVQLIVGPHWPMNQLNKNPNIA